MNERIIEFANEANKDIGYTFKMEEAKQLHELMEKFAELIVKECAEVITETRWHLPPTQQQIAIGIKAHFGVEE